MRMITSIVVAASVLVAGSAAQAHSLDALSTAPSLHGEARQSIQLGSADSGGEVFEDTGIRVSSADSGCDVFKGTGVQVCVTEGGDAGFSVTGIRVS